MEREEAERRHIIILTILCSNWCMFQSTRTPSPPHYSFWIKENVWMKCFLNGLIKLKVFRINESHPLKSSQWQWSFSQKKNLCFALFFHVELSLLKCILSLYFLIKVPIYICVLSNLKLENWEKKVFNSMVFMFRMSWTLKRLHKSIKFDQLKFNKKIK